MPVSALSYLGPVKAATKAKGTEVLTWIEKQGAKIYHMWGYDANVSNTEHHSGLAIDFMLYIRDATGRAVGIDSAAGDKIANYLWQNRARLGIRHIIWNQRIISTVVMPGQWRAMSDRGSPTANHKDHVHVMFLDTPYKAPSVFVNVVHVITKPVVKPVVKRPTVPTLQYGMKGAAVTLLQKELNRVFPAYSRLRVDGDFGPATRAVVIEFQRRTGLARDGIVGPATRAKLAANGVRF